MDSGTTNTRVRLWDGQSVVATASEAVGARNTAMDGHNGQLRAALKRLIESVQLQSRLLPQAVLAAGMITANIGLFEVPHISAPAGLSRLAAQTVRHDFPDISPLPFYFIPGIKSLPAKLSGETLQEADILRGEEVEVVGLRELMSLTAPAVLMHYGSHHKAISLDASGRVLYSRTAVTGELLLAVSQNTVLKSSVVPLDQMRPDPDMLRLGLRQAQNEGLGRALFLTRVAEQIWHRTKEEATSFLLGALTSLDLPLLSEARNAGASVVLYGKGHFPPILKQYLEEQGWPDVHLVAEETAELSSAVGAARVYERIVTLP